MDKEIASARQNDRVILFVPGMNALKQQPLFETLKEEALVRSIDAVCLNTWKSGTDLGALTIDEIVRSIREQTSSLASQGYQEIYAVGKSFGGGMLLAAKDQFIRKLVLWAPAIAVDEGNGSGTLDSLRSRPLGSIDSILSITLGKNFLRSIRTPMDILHGTEDEAVPLSNSELLSSLIPDAHLHPFQGQGHSPEDQEEVLELVRTSLGRITI